MYNSKKSDLLDVYANDTRQNILDFLNFKKGQGETLRNMVRELQIPVATLLWHLRILEQFGLIVMQKINRESVIISSDYFNDFDYELKAFEMSFKSLKAKKFYNYLVSLEKDQVFTLQSISNNINWVTRTMHRHISKLIELGIIEKTSNGQGYIICPKYYFKIKNSY